MKLTKEEAEELKSLEEEEKQRLDEEAGAAKRQHLEALRMTKRLAAKHGTPGRDFLVLETNLGNIAIRRPVDVETDEISDDADRAKIEELATAITLEPKTEELQGLMAKHHNLASVILMQSLKMLRVMREEDAKK